MQTDTIKTLIFQMINPNMKVSIITPCYNAVTFIEATIHSIQQQTLRDWELLVVDDGSVDNSADIIRRIAKDDSRIKLIQKENGGTASARKLGLEHAQGEYIQFLDADDLIVTDKLQCQVELMDKEGLDVSYTDWCYISPSGKKEKTLGMNCGLVRQLAFWGTFGTIPIHSFLYRRDFLEQNSITFTTAIKEREDWDFHIQIYSAHPSMKRIKGYCAAMYMKSPEGKTSCGNMDKIRSGNLHFLVYEAENLHGYKRFLLLVRLSVELCFLFLSTIKYRLWSQLSLLNIFQQSMFATLELVIAILLIPIAILIIIAYLCRTRFRTL